MKGGRVWYTTVLLVACSSMLLLYVSAQEDAQEEGVVELVLPPSPSPHLMLHHVFTQLDEATEENVASNPLRYVSDSRQVRPDEAMSTTVMSVHRNPFFMTLKACRVVFGLNPDTPCFPHSVALFEKAAQRKIDVLAQQASTNAHAVTQVFRDKSSQLWLGMEVQVEHPILGIDVARLRVPLDSSDLHTPAGGEKAKVKLSAKKYNPVTRKHEIFVEKKLPPHSK